MNMSTLSRRLWCAMVITLSTASWGAFAQTAGPAKLRVGVEGNYPPFSRLGTDGKLSGFDIDIALAVCERLKSVETELLARLEVQAKDVITASRAYDKNRDGFVIAGGAGVLVLEEYEHAKARGARIYAELAGFGMSADAGHMTAPNMDGPRRAMLSALRNAALNPDDIDYLNAHGTSTPLGDINETNAIKAALGEHAKRIVVSSTKSMTGHLLGGAGGLESVFTVLALYHQKCPPTINLLNQDPECDLDYCANQARDMPIRAALKNNFGFGGTNGALVFKRA